MSVEGGKKRPSGWIVGAWIFALVGTAAYTGWWFYLARQLEAGARQALEKAGGRAGELSVTGWPYRLSVTAQDLDLPTPAGWRIKATRAGATTNPFNPGLWVLDPPEALQIAGADGRFRPVSGEELKASLRVSEAGIERLSILVKSLVAGPGGPGDRGWRVAEGQFHLVHDPNDPQRFALMGEVRDLQLSQGLPGPGAILGDTITHIRVAGPVSQGPALMRSLEAWRQAGGQFDVMDGELLWGPLTFDEVKGELRLEPGGKAEGVLRGVGALKPEGIAVPALTAPVTAEVRGGSLDVLGLSITALPALR